ncbi:DotG/IcmE/VirB10 family protein [Belnapia rosea]|uniref:DotG/IcmE/VirB10 family protein n=1 Tax=Belnapia rosea TaxID=938405 RepID=UPI0015A42DA7|nr:DotG/IcmE/VirB10 family protein [Belnapia rosea]
MAAISATALTAVALVGYLVLRPGTATSNFDPSAAAGTPATIRGGLAGPNRTEEQEHLRQLASTREGTVAQNQGQSYTPNMGGFATREPGDVGPQAGTDTVRLEEAAPPAAPAPAAPAAAPRVATEAEIKSKLDAVNALFASWRGKDSAQNIYEDSNGAARPGQARMAGSTTPAGSPMQTASPPPRATAQRPKRVLMEAGTGVYAVVVTGGNTDQGSPTIIAQALSGLISGRRLMGSFTRQGSGNQPGALLGLRFNSITIDGKPVAVDAFAVAPDTMDSAVASRVDPHRVERLVLPAAAAFVQGLGQALLSSGSTVASGPYGGYAAFRQFSPEQMLGIGAGAAGASAGQMLREQAPRERTIYIDAGAELGIMFRTSLEVEE